MSKQLLELLLNELKKIRIACKGRRNGKPCGAIIEIALADLNGFFRKDECECPWCGQPFYPAIEGESVKNPFNLLAEAIKGLLSMQKQATVTFLIEEEEDEPQPAAGERSNV